MNLNSLSKCTLTFLAKVN